MNPYDAGINGPAGKLIRNRSTKANDDWWRAVQDAAKTSPKLTYERSAPMLKVEIEYNMPNWPNYLIQKTGPRLRQDGFREAPKISVGALNDDQVEALCEDLRKHCANRKERTHGE